MGNIKRKNKNYKCDYMKCDCKFSIKRETKNRLWGRWLDKRQPLYYTYCGMKNRCYSKEVKSYPDYGGRGILVCERWVNCFFDFQNDIPPKPSPKHTLDRVDTNWGYCPHNIRWATRREQVINRRPLKNSTGFEGVSIMGDRYISRIRTKGGSRLTLGPFDTALEAHESYIKEKLLIK